SLSSHSVLKRQHKYSISIIFVVVNIVLSVIHRIPSIIACFASYEQTLTEKAVTHHGRKTFLSPVQCRRQICKGHNMGFNKCEVSPCIVLFIIIFISPHVWLNVFMLSGMMFVLL
uniref:Uncharacterized protein n=1 Tax=Myripristis murdjan TaxID=586833 RepID=A0A667ZHR1_9TELE